ncbi:NAD(P)H-hydrate dehydratase [Robbsia andropogonis]|uniref:NAD(P)H-hydrate dehydratase n=1 Tax=Robbsia andropogonis TaxID=28092 RepID=UPI002A698F11|nr:NAD(P)H-hydrate dehydratase [Robbsia andropogonis]
MSAGPVPPTPLTHNDRRAATPPDDAGGPANTQGWFPIDTHRLAWPLATVADLRTVEARVMQSAGSHVLMERAGAATADFLLRQRRTRRRPGSDDDHIAATGTPGAGSPGTDDHDLASTPIWFFAGPGNNGGDALVAATRLHRLGVPVRVTLPAPPTHGDALWAYTEARRDAVPIQQDAPDDTQCTALREGGWCVDGLFGIGLNRPVSAPYDQYIKLINALGEHGTHVLALDIPSGLDAMTGQCVSPASDNDCAVYATHTLSFIGATPGLFTGKGRDHTGALFLSPLSLPDFIVRAPSTLATPSAYPFIDATSAQDARVRSDSQPVAPLQLNAPSLFMHCFRKRRPSSHKGTFGSVAIIGGDTGTCGAAILCARAALYAGAGRVHTALIGEGAPPYDPPHPEIMLRRIDAIALDTMDALSIGPGLGTSARAGDIVKRVLHDVVGEDCRALLDADALNVIARDAALCAAVAAAGKWLVMTPHPGEAARLLDIGTRDVEQDRLAAARALVERFRCTIVLKGSGTLIAAPSLAAATASGTATATSCGDIPESVVSVDIVLNTTGNTGLATGGSGDVLSGVIGALLAQGLPSKEAALTGVYLHGLAAETLAAHGDGPAGLTAGELAPMIRRLLNTHLREHGLIVG